MFHRCWRIDYYVFSPATTRKFLFFDIAWSESTNDVSTLFKLDRVKLNESLLKIGDEFHFMCPYTVWCRRPSSIPSKLSQFHRDHSKKPPADVVIPVNNSSVMQSFRKNFVNELQELTLPTRTSCVSQKRISEYFPEVKSVEPTSCTQGARTKKRSLQELKMKYDSVQNMVANLSSN